MFNRMSDEDILALIRSNSDNDAMEYLIKKYMPLVKKESRKLYIIGAENEDLIQEGMIGLMKAIRDYNESKGASFSTFAGLCVKRQMVTAVNTSNRKKHLPLNYYVSLYASDGDSDAELVDELMAGDSSEPEEILIERIKKESVYDMIEKRLSRYEKQVLSEYLTGDSYEIISGRMNKPVKSIDNAIQRIRKKLKA